MSRTKPKREDGEILSSRAAEPVGPYPHARRVGNLLFVSGTGPRRRGQKDTPGVTLDAQGKVASYDITAQCRAVFENLRSIVEDAGSSWDRIVDVTAFLTDMDDFPAYNAVYAEHFTENRPTRTTVQVSRLPGPIAVELKVIATID
ncbi:MAG TPA: RidA family protein [Candidatus Polarisedimenticolia bacterium]|nr:RidA family protein [Candidatus Polarisedimenticolia bacterium]